MIKRLFYLLIIILIVYAAVLFVPPFYRYYAFKSDLKEFARVGVTLPHKELMERIISSARSYKVPIDEGDIIITRNHELYIEVSWQERVNFLNIYEREFDFFIDTGA